MKMKKSISKILLSLVLCTAILPVPTVMPSAYAATGASVQSAGALTGLSVTVNGVSAITFSPETTSYTVNVPVIYENGNVSQPTYSMPVIEATAATGYTADVDMPQTLPNKAHVYVKQDGTTVGSYEIMLNLKGANMYTDGGFESGDVDSASSFKLDGGTPLTITDDVAFTGTKSALSATTNTYFQHDPAIVLEANKVYLSSYAVKKPSATVSFTVLDCVESLTNGQTAEVTFYNAGTKLITKTTDAGSDVRNALPEQIGSGWMQPQAVIKPTTAYNMLHFPIDSGWAARGSLYIDDIFTGELNASRVAVTNTDGAATTKLGARTVAQSVNLSAKALNQLGTNAGFEEATFTWSADSGISVENGVVTIPANTPAGSYTVTATTNIATNNIGTVSGTHEIVITSASTGLTGLTVNGGASAIDFDKAVFSYHSNIPVLYVGGDVENKTWTMPTIEATTEAGYNATVTMPESIPGEAVILVKDSQGDTSGTYTVLFGLGGENLYSNGGFEQDGNPYTYEYGGTSNKITENPASGDYALNIRFSGGPAYPTPRVTMAADKTYLSSRMLRSTANTVYDSGCGIQYRVDSFTGSSSFYKNGGTALGSATDSKSYDLPLSRDWNQFDAVITPAVAYNDTQMYNTANWSANNYMAMDNMYLGELVIADVAVLANGKAIPSTLVTSDALSLTLSAEARNSMDTTSGLETRTTAEIVGLTAAPSGVTLSEGVLTIPQGTTGTLKLAVKATPTDAWTNATQTVFEKTIEITLRDSELFSSIQVVGENVGSLSFDAATNSYAVAVPVLYEDGDVNQPSYCLPTLSATPADNGFTATVSMPTALPGKAVITLKNEAGAVTDTCDVNIALMGANFYEDGGFENSSLGVSSEFGYSTNGNSPMTVVDSAAHHGSRSISRPNGFDGIQHKPLISLEADKTYISSYAARTTAENGYAYYDFVESPDKNNESATVVFYENGVNRGSNTAGSNYMEMPDSLTNEWKELLTVITPSTPFAMQHFTCDSGWANHSATLYDDMFLGEMIIGNVVLTMPNGAELGSTLDTSAQVQLRLVAEARNQLNTAGGLETKTTTEIVGLESAPEGVTLNSNGILAIPRNTEGTVKIKVKATPTAAWTNAPQTSFEKTIAITLEGAPLLKKLEAGGSGISDCTFNAVDGSYNVAVPVFYIDGDINQPRYTMPTLSATATETGATTAITMPETLPGKAVVTVSAADGTSLGTCDVNISLMGANFYTDGSFENSSLGVSSEFGYSTNGNSPMSVVDSAAYHGSHSVSRPNGFDGIQHKPLYTLEANKTYISSYAASTTAENGYEYYDAIESPVADQSASMTFYENGTLVGSDTQRQKFMKMPGQLSSTWTELVTIVTPSTPFALTHFTCDSDWGNHSATLYDDMFLGEMIIGDVALMADGKALPVAISTASARTMNVSAVALNQIANTIGLEGKTTTTFTLESAPTGVSFENGVLTIAQGTKGKLVFKAVATPTEAWANAPQKNFEKTISITLADEGFTYEKDGNTVVETLALYHTGATGTAKLYHAVYSEVSGALRLDAVTSENVKLTQNELFGKTTTLNVASGKVVKSYLLIDGVLKPITAAGLCQ